MPGYVKTNLSKNAYAANEGEKFNATDSNIAKGMAADAFAKEAVKAIFMKENEVPARASSALANSTTICCRLHVLFETPRWSA